MLNMSVLSPLRVLVFACGASFFSYTSLAVAEQPISFPPLVISADAPNQAFIVEGDPKQARQPIPASDAGDF